MKKIVILSMILVVAVATKAMVTTPTINRTLTVSKSGNGTGYVTSDTEAALGKTVRIKNGTIVTLTAKPMENSSFTKWTGSCSGTTPTCSVTMDQNKTVVAVFTPIVKSLNSGELSSINATCAAAALTKRDSTLIAAEQKHSSSTINVWNTRTTAQKAAFAKTGADRLTAFKAAQSTAKDAQSVINRAYTDSKQSATAIYRLEMRACGFQDDNTDE